MKRIITTGAILLGSLTAFGATAQITAEDAQSAVDTRQGLFQVLAFSNAPLGLMARGAEYDEEAALQAVDRVAMLAGMIPEVFIDNTSTHGDLETRALESIWQNKDEFDQMAMDLQNGAIAAKQILQEQGADGVRNAIREIGPKCGACHDRFRLDE